MESIYSKQTDINFGNDILNFSQDNQEDYFWVQNISDKLLEGKSLDYLKEFSYGGKDYILGSAIMGASVHYYSIIGDGSGSYFIVNKLGSNELIKLDTSRNGYKDSSGNEISFKLITDLIYYNKSKISGGKIKIITNYDEYFPPALGSPLKLKRTKYLSPTSKIKVARKKRKTNIQKLNALR